MNWRTVFSLDHFQEDISQASSAERIEISISSVKDTEGFGPKGERGSYPVSTVARYRFSDGGKWNSFVDADSGEQSSLATKIPEMVGQLLKAFGLSEAPKKL